jgi:hypothetical protein
LVGLVVCTVGVVAVDAVVGGDGDIVGGMGCDRERAWWVVERCGGWVQGDLPESGVGLAWALEDDVVVFANGDVSAGENGSAAVVTKQSDGEEGLAELWENVRFLAAGGSCQIGKRPSWVACSLVLFGRSAPMPQLVAWRLLHGVLRLPKLAVAPVSAM